MKRFINWIKVGLGLCPQDGCWNDAAGNHVGMCGDCWDGKKSPETKIE